MTTALIFDVDQLQKENAGLRCALEQSNQKITYLEEQLEWFKRQIFGAKSEKNIPNLNEQQLPLEGFDNLSEQPPAAQTIPAHVRKKPNRNGQDKIVLDSNLPVKTIVIDIPEEQKTCSITGQPLVKIGEDKTLKLAHIPGSYYIKEIIRPKYAVPHREEAGITMASLPDSILPRCRADNSFLAMLLVKKFADHLPLYRISEEMERDGVSISRKLLSQWTVAAGLALRPLYDEMLRQILASGNIFIDETPVKFFDESIEQGYVWTIVGGKGSNPPWRIYQFQEDRRHCHASKIVANYHGVLHSDKYGAYEVLAQREEIIWCPCWVHVRRKFIEAETGDPPFREWVLNQIQQLFLLEEEAWRLSPDERLQIRREKEVPIIDELIEKIKSRLIEGKVLPKSKFREALGYFCGLIPYLKTYTLYPDARLDNNVAERAIRPLTIGRKNWLFFGSADGGQAGAIILSLVQTCRGLEINPREYLEDIFGRLMSHSSQKLHELLPDQWRLARLASASAIRAI